MNGAGMPSKPSMPPQSTDNDRQFENERMIMSTNVVSDRS